MKDRSYNIILEPQIQNGLDQSEVVRKLAALFKRDELVIEELLALSPKVIRKDLDRSTAEKYVRLIQAAGASAKVVPEQIPESKRKPDLQASHARQSAAETTKSSEQPFQKPEGEPERPVETGSDLPASETEQQSAASQYAQDENTCPRCGYKAESDDDVLLVRGDCPRCGLLVKKELAATRDSQRSEEGSETDYYRDNIPASWERRFLASIYTFSMFLGAYACLTLIFILVFAPLDSVAEYIGKRFLASAFDAFPTFTTALIVIGLCMVIPWFNGGRSWAQKELEIHLLYTPEAQGGGLYLSLLFRFAAIMMLTFLPGMIVLWIGYAFERFESHWATNIVTVVCAALSWAAASLYVRRRPDKRSLLDLAAGTIQVEEIALSDEARKKALAPFAAAVGTWVFLGGLLPFILKTLRW